MTLDPDRAAPPPSARRFRDLRALAEGDVLLSRADGLTERIPTRLDEIIRAAASPARPVRPAHNAPEAW